jgi:hypothetical protein
MVSLFAVQVTWLLLGLVVFVDILIDDWDFGRVNVNAGRKLESKKTKQIC